LFSIEIEREEDREQGEREKGGKKQFSGKKGKRVEEKCKAIRWRIIPDSVVENLEDQGVYFLKTSLKKEGDDVAQEELVWTIYNCIRNIESSFRTLKTDLDLRPIFHQTDKASEAHLHLGLLAYWLVNTVRYKLKSIIFTRSGEKLFG